jgi:hypothetical protein
LDRGAVAEINKRASIAAMSQARTSCTTTSAIMRSTAFRRGFEQARAGEPPQFDGCCGGDPWAYERGRLFAYIAPLAMSLRADGKLNPKAVALFDAAFDRGLIL